MNIELMEIEYYYYCYRDNQHNRNKCTHDDIERPPAKKWNNSLNKFI